MDVILREYREHDYEQCEELVNRAWGFDALFSPKALADVAKTIYTKGSILGSNYTMVAQVDAKIAGFIFGLDAHSRRPGLNLRFRLALLWKLIWIRKSRPDRDDLLQAMQEHERNRADIVERGRSEIILFVVGEAYRGTGIGTQLWNGFREQCEASGVRSIVVETNRLGASGFYERLGFEHLADFDSPLHELATPGGQACMYAYTFAEAH